MNGEQALGAMMIFGIIGIIFLGLVNGCSSDPVELDKKASDGTVVEINISWNGEEIAHELVRKGAALDR